MKKSVWALFAVLVIVGCSGKVDESALPEINGYWQIEKVILADGSEKEYQANTSYDFLQLKGKDGFRQKVDPQYDGSFRTNELHETFKVRNDKDGIWLDYRTDYAKWSEQLLELDHEHLVTKNNQKLEYHYKRAEPMNLLGDEQKTK